MDEIRIRKLSSGVNQSGVRDFNERLLLSILQRHGPTAGIDLAKISGLSPQTVSIILREMEREGLLLRGAPIKGKVGKPSIPMILAPGGVISFGFKIGRRSTQVLLSDFCGTILAERTLSYAFPLTETVLAFLEQSYDEIRAELTPEQTARLCGIGVAIPFEIWKWHDYSTTPPPEFQLWEKLDLAREISRFSNLPVSIINDATAACQAEHIYGRGKEFRDYAYFFIGAYVGGGVVLNHSVYHGHRGNAGALGSLRSYGLHGESLQLIDTASIHVLEKHMTDLGLNAQALWQHPLNWTPFQRLVDAWIGQTAQELARASLSACAVIDFEAIIVDGAFPEEVKQALVERTRRYMVNQDTRGLIPPRIEAGWVGTNARSIGAAATPLFERYFMNGNLSLSNR